MNELSKKELHQIAMTHVGRDLESKGFEFIAVNSELKKHPQFVCVDKPTNTLHFVLVEVKHYPEDIMAYDVVWMETFKAHAQKLKAKVFFAGVGIANSNDYEAPVVLNQDYTIFYEGFQEIM